MRRLFLMNCKVLERKWSWTISVNFWHYLEVGNWGGGGGPDKSRYNESLFEIQTGCLLNISKKCVDVILMSSAVLTF
jgi:hypothetical protein